MQLFARFSPRRWGVFGAALACATLGLTGTSSAATLPNPCTMLPLSIVGKIFKAAPRIYGQPVKSVSGTNPALTCAITLGGSDLDITIYGIPGSTSVEADAGVPRKAEATLGKLGVLIADSSFTTVRFSHGKYYLDMYYPAPATAEMLTFAHDLYAKL